MLKLVGEGRLQLDAPVGAAPYTLRQLLQHRAGVPSYGRLDTYHAAVVRGDPPWPRRQLLAAVGAKRLGFAPGTGWAYSNVGYLFLRELLETTTGCDLATLLRGRIAGPLGLTSLTVARTARDMAATAWGDRRAYHPGWVYHGCCIGTAGDAARLLHALCTGRLLAPELLRQMLDAHPLGGPFEGRPWQSTGYGLGLMIGTMTDAGRAIGHSGGGPLSTNAVYHFPDGGQPVTVAAFSDSLDEGVAENAAARLATVSG